MILMLLNKGIDWNTVDIFWKHGVYLKKILYANNEGVMRSRIEYKCFKIRYNDFFQ